MNLKKFLTISLIGLVLVSMFSFSNEYAIQVESPLVNSNFVVKNSDRTRNERRDRGNPDEWRNNRNQKEIKKFLENNPSYNKTATQ